MRIRRATKIDLLKAVPLFSGCSRAELSRIAAVADEVSVPSGTVLMTEGKRGQQFYVIIEGTVRVTKKGRKLADFGPGDYIGDVALVTKLPRTASGVTTSPVSALVLTDHAFRELINQVPSIAIKVLRSVGERLNSSSV